MGAAAMSLNPPWILPELQVVSDHQESPLILPDQLLGTLMLFILLNRLPWAPDALLCFLLPLPGPSASFWSMYLALESTAPPSCC